MSNLEGRLVRYVLGVRAQNQEDRMTSRQTKRLGKQDALVSLGMATDLSVVAVAAISETLNQLLTMFLFYL
jgi:hypothetical protein